MAHASCEEKKQCAAELFALKVRPASIYNGIILKSQLIFTLFNGIRKAAKSRLSSRKDGEGLLHDLFHFCTTAAFTRFLADRAAVAAVATGACILGFGREGKILVANFNYDLILANAVYHTFAELVSAGAFPLFISHGLAVAAVTTGADVNRIPFFVYGEGFVGKRYNSDQQQRCYE